MRTLSLCLAAALLVPALLRGDDTKAAKISVDPSSFNFGEVVAGTTVEKEFVVRNFGPEPLAISQIVPSCGCTVVDQSYAKSIPSGGSGTFRLKLTLPRSEGHLVKSVLVKSNDPLKPSFEVKLEATVVTGR